jgi:hypothetical protein
MDVNAGAYISYLCAMYALDADDYYKAGWVLCFLHIMKQPGFGPYLLKKSNCRYIYANYDDETRFLSGLWRKYVMEKTGDMSEYSLETSINSLVVPLSDDRVPSGINENNIVEANNHNFKLFLSRNENVLRFESKDEVKRMEVYSLTGQKLLSIPINSNQGTVDLNRFGANFVIVRAFFNNNFEVKKILLK